MSLKWHRVSNLFSLSSMITLVANDVENLNLWRPDIKWFRIFFCRREDTNKNDRRHFVRYRCTSIFKWGKESVTATWVTPWSSSRPGKIMIRITKHKLHNHMDTRTIPAMKHCWGSQGSCQMASLSHNELNRCWLDPHSQSELKFEVEVWIQSKTSILIKCILNVKIKTILFRYQHMKL